jgi:hypothetical protein
LYEVGYPTDGGIPNDTVQRGSSKYLRGDPTTPKIFDFRLFHDKIIQRGDIRFFLIFLTPTNNGVFRKNMVLKIEINFISSTVIKTF